MAKKAEAQYFTTPGDENVVVHLTTGHSCLIEPKGSLVPPRFFREAMRMGCIPQGFEEHLEAADVEHGNAEETREHRVQRGFRMMVDEDPERKENFTNDGKPDIRILSSKIGFTVNREERDRLWAEFTAEEESGGEESGGDDS